MSATPDSTASAATDLGPSQDSCLECGAALAGDQRYCLNCGRRHVPGPAYSQLITGDGSPPSSAAPGATATFAGDPRTVTPVGAAAALGLVLLAVLLGAVIGSRGSDAGPAPVVSVASAPATAVSFTNAWTGSDGWAIMLASLPKTNTTPAQVAEAERSASSKGVPAVAALDSDEFPSLEAGRYVVYSGRFASKAKAQAALGPVREQFPDASVIRVTRDAASGKATTGAKKGSSSRESNTPANKTVENLEKSSPEDYVKKSKKLPDELSTGGKTPKKDDKAPGGGDGGAEVIE